MNIYLNSVNMKRLGELYEVVHKLPFWKGVMRRVRKGWLRNGDMYEREMYNTQRNHRNTKMIESIQEWLDEAKKKNNLGQL